MTRPYRIDWLKLPFEYQEFVSNINGSWSDLEYLQHLFHRTLGSISEAEGNESMDLYSCLGILGNTFYIYSDIIRQQTLRLGRLDENISRINTSYRSLWDKVNMVRNRIIVHKEKSNYLQVKGEFSSTTPDTLFMQILTYEDEGLDKQLELHPIQDVRMIKQYLEELDQYLLTLHEEK